MKRKTITSIILTSIVAGGLLLALGTLYEVEAQVPPSGAFLSNVVLNPVGETLSVVISGVGVNFVVGTANANGQSPFFTYPSGTYDISASNPTGFNLINAFCIFQEDGNNIAIGAYDGTSTVAGITLTTARAHVCTWVYEGEDTLEENVKQLQAQIAALDIKDSTLQELIDKKLGEIQILQNDKSATAAQKALAIQQLQDLLDTLTR